MRPWAGGLWKWWRLWRSCNRRGYVFLQALKLGQILTRQGKPHTFGTPVNAHNVVPLPIVQQLYTINTPVGIGPALSGLGGIGAPHMYYGAVAFRNVMQLLLKKASTHTAAKQGYIFLGAQGAVGKAAIGGFAGGYQAGIGGKQVQKALPVTGGARLAANYLVQGLNYGPGRLYISLLWLCHGSYCAGHCAQQAV